MTSVANTSPETAREAPVDALGQSCPECGARVVAAGPRAIFCCTAHKRAWDARSRLRGRQILPFAAAARQTRGGDRGDKETGWRAERDLDFLLTKWRDEDRAANDGRGRMSQVDYLRLRYRLGFGRP